MRRLSVATAAVWLAAAATLLGAASEPRTSGSPKVGEVIRKLQARYDATKDFTADFTQTVEAATLGKPLESTGQVLFKRPGRMRWTMCD